MKILCAGDLHMRMELPYASAFEDGRRGEWEAVKKTIQDTAKNCDAVVFLGDLFNLKHNHSSVITELVEFLKSFRDKEIHMLCGNHERYGKSSALDFLDRVKHKNWFVYLEPTLAKVAGKEAMMIPFMSPALLGVETKEEGIKAIVEKFPKNQIPLAFSHHGISGTAVHGISVDLLNEIILPKEVMEKHFDFTFSGHIHDKQVLSEGVIMTGNIFTGEVGEYEKSVWVYEDSGVGASFFEVPLPVRGIYKIDWNADLNKIPEHSIVKCIITNRTTDINFVQKEMKRFDASIIVEQYENERKKTHFESGVLDLSVENLLKMYAEAKGLVHQDIVEGFALIQK